MIDALSRLDGSLKGDLLLAVDVTRVTRMAHPGELSAVVRGKIEQSGQILWPCPGRRDTAVYMFSKRRRLQSATWEGKRGDDHPQAGRGYQGGWTGTGVPGRRSPAGWGVSRDTVARYA